MPDQPLPEGTDHILDGDGHDEVPDALADLDDAETAELADDITLEQQQEGTADAGDLRSAFFGKFDALRGQATDRVFGLAQDGKDRATSALDDIARTVEDAAGEIDSRIGTQYGDYARRAAESIGGFSEAFKGKDVDALFADARELVKKSPAVAIGAAAALGFIVARLVKAGVPETDAKDKANPDGRAA
jgi:ElaB/YqjD/DUF883 family membrane-anchored ribosome-binding protein